VGPPLVRCAERVKKVTGSQHDGLVKTEESPYSSSRWSGRFVRPTRIVIPSAAEGTPAMPILPVPFGAFQARKPAPNEGLANKVTSSQDDEFC
jgi:hypothetical protein